MPVYDRRYRGWEGERRSPRRSLLVLTRYGLAEAFSSRLTLVLFVASCLPFVAFAVAIYVANNLDVLTSIQVSDPGPLIESLSGKLFFWFLLVQSGFAFILASFAGPALVGPDLAHGAMPLYLSRPVGRSEYVLGKLLVLLTLLSAVTWVPGMLLILIEGSLAPAGWFASHLRLAFAMFAGAWIWILLLGVLALAISAWIRWRPLATGALFVLFFVGTAFGTAVNVTLETKWGKLLILGEPVKSIWNALFGSAPFASRNWEQSLLPVGAAWLDLGLVLALAVWVLHRRIRAFEVVR